MIKETHNFSMNELNINIQANDRTMQLRHIIQLHVITERTQRICILRHAQNNVLYDSRMIFGLCIAPRTLN